MAQLLFPYSHDFKKDLATARAMGIVGATEKIKKSDLYDRLYLRNSELISQGVTETAKIKTRSSAQQIREAAATGDEWALLGTMIKTVLY